MASLTEVVRYADEYLRISEIEDWAEALYGLQIENSGAVAKIGATIDAPTATLQAAAERGINLLSVHHGLFWSGPSLQERRGVVRSFRYGRTVSVRSFPSPPW